MIPILGSPNPVHRSTVSPQSRPHHPFSAAVATHQATGILSVRVEKGRRSLETTLAARVYVREGQILNRLLHVPLVCIIELSLAEPPSLLASSQMPLPKYTVPL